jgi:RNA polymerase sigma-70 factor (ECF subfamily)
MTSPHFPPSSEAFAGLLAQARAGSAEALGKAFTLCQPDLQRSARALLRPPSLQAKFDDDDLLQITFLKAEQKFARFHGATQQELLAWLQRILERVIKDLQTRFLSSAKRSVRREVPLDDQRFGLVLKPHLLSTTPPPDAPVLAEESRAVIQEALRHLPEPYARVIELHSLEELPFEEVAAQFGRSAEATRQLHRRAMARLERILRGRR